MILYSRKIFLIFFSVTLTGCIVARGSLERDREVLLELGRFISKNNRTSGRNWNESDKSPCAWEGITCNGSPPRVTSVSLPNWRISGPIFEGFSNLSQLTVLDLSSNVIRGKISSDLNLCSNLRYLNLSYNILEGYLNLSGLNKLEVLDVSVNRLRGTIQSNFGDICKNLVTLNLSSNKFTGEIRNIFDRCKNLQNLDLSYNEFIGPIFLGFTRMKEFSVAKNNITGSLQNMFPENCGLELLDLSGNDFHGGIPREISNCRGLIELNLWGNNFVGPIPTEVGLFSNLNSLFLGRNNLSREIPESLTNCTNLIILDLSGNSFGGNIQDIFGRLTQVRFLLLHKNSYTGGIESSGILDLPNLQRLDLSLNNFSGTLPIQITKMPSLKFLILSRNQFTGHIPAELGNISTLQALDLSFNNFIGQIPRTIGNLKSLLWLMLANNSLSGEIPPEIGNCDSLLWLNLANNQLSGNIPTEISRMGKNPYPTFNFNRINDSRVTAGSGECLVMKRWIPTDYPPFSFVYNLLTRKHCRNIWNRLLKGYGIYPTCPGSPDFKYLVNSGYIQLTGNQFSGQIPPEIGKMKNFSFFHFGNNNLSGSIPPEISQIPLVVLNISHNKISHEIPSQIGDMKCLQNLDLSFNNLSGKFPLSLLYLTNLNKFNISYNSQLTGEVPAIGQFATFDRNSYLGNPNLTVRSLISTQLFPPIASIKPQKRSSRKSILIVSLCICSIAILFLIGLIIFRNRTTSTVIPVSYSLEETKLNASCSSSTTKTFGILDKTRTIFTYEDIMKATHNFSDEMIIGSGGFSTVYRGILSNGKQVAVKKLVRGSAGERDFCTEMEVFNRKGVEWSHPNLVELFGWCLFEKEKLLVYEYMEGGSVEKLLPQWKEYGCRQRVETAVGVARALAFLHHDCNPAVLHRDLKASNVLLDKDGRARVTDFGLARVVSTSETHVSTMLAGTVGYIPPEYGQTSRATTKGDVYSYGIFLMELATGRMAVDGGEKECLVEWLEMVERGGDKEGGLKNILEERTKDKDGAHAMLRLLRISRLCTAAKPKWRPDMKKVLSMLLKVPLPKQ